MIPTLCTLALAVTLLVCAARICSELSRITRKIEESTETLRHELHEIRRNIATESLASANPTELGYMSTAEMNPRVKEWTEKMGYKDPADGLLPKS